MTDESTPSIANRRERFEAEVAPLLVQQTVGALPAWRTTKLSKRVSFFRDDHTLCVVAHPSGDQRDTDTALAWGLAYAGDRDLALFLPDRAEEPTLQRAAWITVPLRVFTYDDNQPAG